MSLIESRERRLVEAIKRGATVEPMVAALKEEEARKNTLARERAALGSVERVASLDEEQIKRDLRARIAEVKALLARRGYHFGAEGTCERLFSGTALEPLARTVVAPTGHVRTHIIQVRDFITR